MNSEEKQKLERSDSGVFKIHSDQNKFSKGDGNVFDSEWLVNGQPSTFIIQNVKKT